jgi:outer membrane protein OmpA-like peptidoglycan-associated protein
MDRSLHHPDHRSPHRHSRSALRRRRASQLATALLLLGGCASTDPGYTTYTPVPTREATESGAASPATAATAASSDDRVTAVEGRMNEMNQRLDQMGGRVQQLEGGVKTAQGRADEAAKKAEGVDSRLTRLWTNRFNQKQADSLEVYFAPDSIDLSDAAQTALAAVVREMEAHPTLTVELGGYTDPKGALDYNYGLSQRRVDAVRRFLMDKGITLARIQSASLGPITGGDIPDAKKRRVTLRLMVDPE